MKALKQLQDVYVRLHANSIKLPVFKESAEVRKNILFSGKVQKVGFRLELYTIAQRLKLTGWVKNLEDGNVEAELQGEEAKVNFLVTAMKSLKRASVEECDITTLPAQKSEESLTIIR